MSLKITVANNLPEDHPLVIGASESPNPDVEIMKLELVPENADILNQETVPFNFKNPPVDPARLFISMKEKLIECRGVGLACPQVGLPYKMFVIGVYDDPDTILGVFNPIITSAVDQKETMIEGCLSFPDLYVKIKRPFAIRVRYTTWNDNTDAIKFDGLTARAFQHEYDHLFGLTFFDRANKFHMTKARKDRKLLWRKRKANKNQNSSVFLTK